MTDLKDDSIPQHVADSVEQEARAFEANFYTLYSTFKQIVPEVYKKAVQPYAEKVYVMEQLIMQQNGQIDYLRESLDDLRKLLHSGIDTINGILKD